MTTHDSSNGYEAIADSFISTRNRSIGASVVAEWSHDLPPGAEILDLGCGAGVPISQILIDRGFSLHGIDASPSLLAAFRSRFPDVPVECASVERSAFFGKTFNAVVAWGLFFLLDEATQLRLIAKISKALRPNGRLLFTAPSRRCSWPDALTGRTSVSLGLDAYRQALERENMSLLGTMTDEGGNFYYSAAKRA